MRLNQVRLIIEILWYFDYKIVCKLSVDYYRMRSIYSFTIYFQYLLRLPKDGTVENLKEVISIKTGVNMRDVSEPFSVPFTNTCMCVPSGSPIHRVNRENGK